MFGKPLARDSIRTCVRLAPETRCRSWRRRGSWGPRLEVDVGPQVLDRTSRLVEAQNRLDAQIARSVREGEPPRPPSTTGRRPCSPGCAGTADSPPRGPGAAGFRPGAGVPVALAAAFADGGSPPNRSRRSPRSPATSTGAAAAAGVDLAAVDAEAGRARRRRGRTATRPAVHSTRSGSTPTARSQTPPRAAALLVQACRRPGLRPVGAGRRRRGEGAGRAGVDGQATGPPATPAPPANSAATRSCIGRPHPRLRAHAHPAHGQAAPGRHHSARRPDRPATGPGAADTGLGDTISAARARWLACDATSAG